MANRFPLIVNPDTKEIQEIAQNDNLDLTGNGIYAGGSLGQNGQVLTTNGTSVEWRTVTSSGGGGGLDSDTTYIIQAEDASDGATLNLVAGGSGIGTIRVKFRDSDQIQFDTLDNLTFQPSIKDNSITNSKLQNSGFSIQVDGVVNNVALGGSVVIPIYGDVFKTASQAISNKTFTNCSMSLASSAGNTIVSIPNSSLINSSININGTNVPLGGSITIAGGGGSTTDTNTTYTLSANDGTSGEAVIRLQGSDATATGVSLFAGDRISLTRNGDEITINGTEINTNTDTLYNLSIDTLIENTFATGVRLNLNSTGDGVGSGTTDRVNIRSGTGVTVSSSSDSDITVSIPQEISSTSNVTFNNLTINGSLTVAGALTYVNTTNLVVTDKTITIADGVTNSEQSNGSGILLGTSNINLVYNHDSAAWRSTSNFDLVPTKTYKIGGTEVLSATQVLGKSVPVGAFVGTIDTQTLSNKTLNSPVISSIINTGTIYLPAPNIADTLVGRNTSDTLTNKSIDGTLNTITNIPNSSISNSYITINGTQVNLGGSISVTTQDPYSDEKAQDTVAGAFTSGNHTGISFSYDDTAGKINATVTALSIDNLTDVDTGTVGPQNGEALIWDSATGKWEPGVATAQPTPAGASGNIQINNNGTLGATANLSWDIANNTLGLNGEFHLASSAFRIFQVSGNSVIGNVSGTGNVVMRCGQGQEILFTNENGATTFARLSNAECILSAQLTAGGLTYPNSNGNNGDVLTSNGSGNVTWTTPTAPVAVGCINMNGTSPTWTGTSNYTVTGAQPGGAGTDYVYTLSFPSAYSARTDYIVQATYDGTDYISTNSCELAVARGTGSVVFTPRRLDGQPLNGGDIMVTIIEL